MSSEAARTPVEAPASRLGDLAISVEHLSKCYQIYEKPQHRLWQGLFRGRRQFFREFWALREVSFTAQKGETLGIIGRNGSGKSTLLQLICGTLTPTAGEITCNGRIGALLELGAGFNPEFTGRENVYLNGAILGLTRREMDDRLDAIVAFADLGEFFDQPVKTYSSGMYVRLAFAVIAHIDAEILVIDEALAVGDAVFAQKCMRFLRRFKERGTIIFVSHDTGAVINLCRRALWLHAGQTVMLGSAKQVVESYLKAAMQASQGQDFTPALESHASTAEAAGAREPEASVEEAAPPSTSRPTAAAPFTFDPDAPSFGKGGASIEAAEVLGEDCKPLSLIRGGEYARLRITIRANEDIDGVIVGFLLKDRLGQVLFGANTFLETVGRPVNLAAGETATADLGFEMPHLQTGTYAIDLAVAEGTLDAHVQHQWFYDAVIVEIVATDAIYGLMRPRRAQASLVKCAVDDVGDVSGAASRKVTAS